MIITKQNPKGGPPLTGFPIEIDPDSGVLGYKLGYVVCECGNNKTIMMRTVDCRHIVNTFGVSLDEYDNVVGQLNPKKREPLRNRIIKFLGGDPKD